MLIMGLINFIMLIVFCFMAVNIAAMKTQLKALGHIAEAYSKQTGIGKTYTCNGCKKKFEGKPSECPHCKIAIPW